MSAKKVEIGGMSCGHCANSITEALKKIDGVSGVEVSLESKNAILKCNMKITSDDLIRSAVETAGYSVVSITKER